MVTIRICRKTGKQLSVHVEPSPRDQPIEKLAAIIADWAIRNGILDEIKKDATA